MMSFSSLSPSSITVRRRFWQPAMASALFAFVMLGSANAQSGGESGDSKDQSEVTSLKQALARGKAAVFLRYRYEFVDQDGFSEDAHASTLRTTLSYTSQPFKGWSGFLEAENIVELGDDSLYNNRGFGDAGNGVADRPVVADPGLTQINQAFVQKTHDWFTLRAGREEIIHGNQRFVGNVGWRQNHQSFDAVEISGKRKDTQVRYAYLADVRRILGDHRELAGHLLHGEHGLGAWGRVSGYGYFLDFEDFPQTSTRTFGIELNGKREVRDRLHLLYEAKWARQDEWGDNSSNIDADYARLLGGLDVRNIRVSFGIERLSGTPEDGAFQTPLGTNHAFNGWADKFLNTPENGLRDIHLTVDGAIRKLRLSLRYHDFHSTNDRLDYGNELDLMATYPTSWGQLFAFKAAFYRSESFATDTSKIWLWSQYRF